MRSTNNLHRVAVVGLTVLSFGVAAGTVRAQTSASGGGGSRFDVSVHVAEAYDDNLQAEVGHVTPSAYQTSGYYTILAPTATFEARGRRVQFAGTGGTNARYYSDFGEWLGTTTFGGAALAAQLAERTTMSVSQNVSYAPVSLNLFTALPSSSLLNPVPPTSDYATTEEKSLTYTSALALTQGLSSRTAVSFKSDFRYADYKGTQLSLTELRSYDAGARLLHNLDKNVTLRLGYTFRNAVWQSVNHSRTLVLELHVPLLTNAQLWREPRRIQRAVCIDRDGATQLYRLTAGSLINQRMERAGGLAELNLRSPSRCSPNALTLATGGSVGRRSGLTPAPRRAIPAGGAELRFTAGARYRVTFSRTWRRRPCITTDFKSSLSLPQGVRPQLSQQCS